MRCRRCRAKGWSASPARAGAVAGATQAPSRRRRRRVFRKGYRNAEWAKDLVEQSKSSAVKIVRGDDTLARVKRVEQRRAGGEAGREGRRGDATFQRGQGCFQAVACWIAAARVIVALVFAWRALRESAAQVKRGNHCAGGWIRFLAFVDGPGFKFHVSPVSLLLVY